MSQRGNPHWAMSFAGASERLALGAQVGEYGGAVFQVRLVDTVTGEALGTLGSNLTRFLSVAQDARGGHLLANSLTGLWQIDLRAGTARRLCSGFSDLLGVSNGVAFGTQMANGRVFLRPVAEGDPSWVDVVDSDRYVPLAWIAPAPGTAMVAGATREQVVVKSLPIGGATAVMARAVESDGDAKPCALAFDRSARFVALLLRPGALEVFDLASRTCVHRQPIELGLQVDIASHRPAAWLVATGREVLEFEWRAEQASAVPRLQRVVEGGFEWIAPATGGQLAVFANDQEGALIHLADNSVRTADLPGGQAGRFIDGDARWVAVLPDGTLGVFDAATGARLTTICCAGESHSVWFTPANEYLATRGGMGYVAFRRQGRVYDVAQFDALLHRPDRVLAALGAPATTVELLRLARERRLQRLGMMDSEQSDGVPPRISFVAPPPRRTDAAAIQLQVKASAGDAPLAWLQAAVDGVPLFKAPGRAWGDDGADPITVPLLRGTNALEVWGEDCAGRRSLSLRHEVTCSAPAAPSRVFAVGFGVGDYLHARRLPFAAKDVTDLGHWIERTFGDLATVRTFVHADVGPGALREARQLLETAAVADLVIVHLAGHGIRDDAGRYWFAPHNVDFRAPAARGIAFEELMSLVAGLRARHRLILVDTCQAGEFERAPLPSSGGAAGAGSGGAASLASTRGPDTEAASAAVPPLLQEFFVDLRRETGAFVLAAASGESAAIEADGNGYFTKAVLEGLGSAAADGDGDQIVTVRELQTWVSHRVPELSRGRQRPVILRENLDNEFPLRAARMPRVLAATPEFARARGFASLASVMPWPMAADCWWPRTVCSAWLISKRVRPGTSATCPRRPKDSSPRR